jgi:hypothetical protein
VLIGNDLPGDCWWPRYQSLTDGLARSIAYAAPGFSLAGLFAVGKHGLPGV